MHSHERLLLYLFIYVLQSTNQSSTWFDTSAPEVRCGKNIEQVSTYQLAAENEIDKCFKSVTRQQMLSELRMSAGWWFSRGWAGVRPKCRRSIGWVVMWWSHFVRLNENVDLVAALPSPYKYWRMRNCTPNLVQRQLVSDIRLCFQSAAIVHGQLVELSYGRCISVQRVLL